VIIPRPENEKELETEKYVNRLFTYVKHKRMVEMVHKKQRLMNSTMVFKVIISSHQNQEDVQQTHVHNTNYIQYTLDLTDPPISRYQI
jgi:hypothetical protein